MYILIIQQNNIYRLSSDLPQSGPDSPCEGGTRPGSDAASSPVALRCYKVVRGLHSSTVARDRKLTEVLATHWSSDGSAVVVTFDEVNCMVTSLHTTTECAWSIPVTIMSVTWHSIQRYSWQLLTLIIISQSATHPTNYLPPSASPRTPARTAHWDRCQALDCPRFCGRTTLPHYQAQMIDISSQDNSCDSDILATYPRPKISLASTLLSAQPKYRNLGVCGLTVVEVMWRE